MRIAFLAPLVTPIREPQLGGSQAVLADLAAGLTARGHQVDVFAASGSRIEGARFIDTGTDAEQLAATLYRAGKESQRSADSRSAFTRAWALVRGGGYDVAHNHAFDAPAIELAPSDALPVVHTLHLPHDPVVAAAIREAQAGPAPPVVAAVSQTQARRWSLAITVDAVLRNGVPVARIPSGTDPGEGALFAGRFSPEKGTAEAITIGLRAGLEVTVIGAPYDRAYTEDNIEPWRGRPGVRIEDPLPRPELWRRMSRASVVLCPVQWDEPFGLVAAEAQAAGTPVVGFRRGGLIEIVWESVTGSLVQPGDLTEAAEEAAGAARYDRAAIRRHAEATLDIERTLDLHEALYARLTSET